MILVLQRLPLIPLGGRWGKGGSAAYCLHKSRSFATSVFFNLYCFAWLSAVILLGFIAPAHANQSVPVAWGNNDYNQVSLPSGLTNVAALAGGGYHGLALTTDGQVVAWGSDVMGQSSVPAGLSNVIEVAAGGYHSLALKSNGTVVAWGDNSYRQTGVPSGLSNVVAVAAGWMHSLALKGDGTVVAWGAGTNNTGMWPELGQAAIPANLLNVQAIACGGYHSLALRDDGTVVAWGEDGYGQTDVPSDATNVVAIAAGLLDSMALRADGSVLVWGWRYEGLYPPAGLTNVVLIKAGWAYSSAVRQNGTAVVWGYDQQGQINVPVGVTNLTALAGGGFHLLGQTNDGSLTIVRQPRSRTAFSGTTVSFRADAVSATATTSPFRYQWRFNSVAIPGATNASLILPSVQTGSAGIYTVIVSNASQLVISSNAVLAVTNAAPAILSQPADKLVPLGENSSLSVLAVGSLPSWYQWRKNGTNIPGATNASLTLTNMQYTSEGDYSVVISNAYGMALSSNATVLVASLGDVLNSGSLIWELLGTAAWHPESIATGDGLIAISGDLSGSGQYSTLQTTVTGPGVLTFLAAVSSRQGDDFLRFYINDELQMQISGEQNWIPFTYYLPTGSLTLRWEYKQNSTFTGGANAAGLDQVIYVPGPVPPEITSYPISQTVAAGSDVTLAATAVGTPDLHYQWLIRGVAVSSWTNSTLSLTDVQIPFSAPFSFIVTNDYGTASCNFSLTVTSAAPVFITEPQSQAVVAGGNASLTGNARGTLPIAYYWTFNGTPIAGANSTTLDLAGVQDNDTGVYQCTASNRIGITTSSNATVTIVPTKVFGWGDNSSGQTNVPATLTNAIAVAGGWLHSLALKADGTVVAWGAGTTRTGTYPEYGQAIVPAGLTNIVAVACGDTHSFALRADGTLVAWGAGSANTGVWPDYGQAIVPPGLSGVVAVTGGDSHSVALLADGTVVAWGNNMMGQTNVPPGLSNVVAIDSGAFHTLALKADGTVAAFGDDTYSQIDVPAGLSNVVAIATGTYHSMALRSDGTVVSWGDDSAGQATPPPGLDPLALAGGYLHSVSLKQGGVAQAWGSNGVGQLNPPAGISNYVALASGAYHNLAVELGNAAPLFWNQQPASTQFFGGLTILRPLITGLPPMAYQWQRSQSDIPGATGPWLALSNLFDNAGNYRLIVSNAAGFTVGSNIALTIIRPVPLDRSAMQMQPGGFKVAFTNLSGGAPMVLYSTTNLPDWKSILTNEPMAGSTNYLDPSAPGVRYRFYHAEEIAEPPPLDPPN